MAQSHSVTGLHYTETVFTNWFYPQNSELLHASAILLTGSDTLSLFLNFGWLAIAFLAAWCVGRPYGRGPLTVVAAAIVLECHTLVVREPGAAKNDLMAAALLLAAIAILINAARGTSLTRVARWRGRAAATGPASRMLPACRRWAGDRHGGGDQVHRPGDGGGADGRSRRSWRPRGGAGRHRGGGWCRRWPAVATGTCAT